ncbi:glycoside hydrolase family protein [Chitinophagaceae bacterium LB-8]|uniref:Glycoside hydrolase family protein n=1 Tax=Paraflavisolibacter caeni TaxID=2982496 RepID=A0A9X2XX94_9BACT|nr:glycoside hydrolase family protein [Paraflavisolibacter caeni]MCU7550630.1 glycoside hydrolase family protein [Paraflavisolibacter caeni]
MNRRDFISQLSIFTAGACCTHGQAGSFVLNDESSFAKRLHPVGRALEMEGYYVWCNSPIEGDDGKIHVFFSRWDDKKGMSGWINGSEIAHAVADKPEGPYQFVETVLAPRPGYFDATTCHNPLIKKVDGKYCLFYMGNSNGKTNTKRIGLATSDSLYGPWKRPDKPLLEAGPEGAWDDHCTTNPAFIKHPNGQYWLYYKSWNTKEYETQTGPIRGNRKYGLAIAENLEGPYVKYEGNPVIDFSGKGQNRQFEDAFVWREKGKFKMIARDMGVYNHEVGLIMDSKDGKHWNEPLIAYYSADHYNIQQPPPAPYLKRYGRFERPQILFLKGKPAYLFTTSQGGKYMTASSFIFKIF